MWPFSSSTKTYQPLPNEVDERDSIDLDDLRFAHIGPMLAFAYSCSGKSPPQRRKLHLVVLLPTILLLSAAITAYALFRPKQITRQNDLNSDTASPTTSDVCRTRREWRTLSQSEKNHYIASVKCLTTLPSSFRPNSTSYEDFPWVHSHVGYFTHNSAPFLPWHRYFLHIYETTLREQCGYQGTLVYWDWTLDWDDLEHSPVFDPVSGFGGDGDPDGEITVGRSGRCLVDGNFTDIIANFYDVKFKPHCLSRGFRDDTGGLGHIDGQSISPESVEEVLQLDDYEKFVTEMESRVHDTIPFGIGGDFETFTAPYDPLFFLHHTQLDRLWYIWQQRDSEAKLNAYGGHEHRHSIKMASLSDKIKMAGLAPVIQVSDVMDTEGELLCYRY